MGADRLQQSLPNPDDSPWDPHPYQRPPEGDWTIWMIKAGRGAGKTRAAAEYVHRRVRANKADRLYTRHPDPARHVGLVAQTSSDARRVMIQGESGLEAVAEKLKIRFRYRASYGDVEWPDYGVRANMFTSVEPNNLRGPQHDLLWGEEVAAWKDAWKGNALDTTFSNAMLGLRLGRRPVAVLTSTPKPHKLIQEIVKRWREGRGVVITEGSTFANRAHLAANFFDEVISSYKGTRLERQEIYGELIDDVEGALWTRNWIDEHRIIPEDDWWDDWLDYLHGDYQLGPRETPAWPIPDLSELVVGLDPNASSDADADEAGIVVAGRGVDGRGYVFDDRSAVVGPLLWAQRAVDGFYDWNADLVVAEKNNGGEMVLVTIRVADPEVPVELVHASRGKQVRAQPIAELYKRGRVSHVGSHPLLEDQLCNWVPGLGESPGRLDAVVWALTRVMLGAREPVSALSMVTVGKASVTSRAG